MPHQRGVGLLRDRGRDGYGRVTFLELFFDLVFVFAVTQLSHSLIAHFTPIGAVQTALLTLAIWWVWIFTTWVTNWLDPKLIPVKLMMLAMMLAGLVLSVSLPQAFEQSGVVFAGAYVVMQVGRTAFTIWALEKSDRAMVPNFRRILVWLCSAGVVWIAGAFAEGPLRLALWTIALGIEYAAPALGFWTPGLGASRTSDWNVSGEHLAERCGLFIIIALGESILVTGATFARLAWTTPTVLAFLAAFVGSVAMWWIYFDACAEEGSHHIEHSSDPGRIARVAYTYIHLPIVAGIIVVAVADEFVLAHPTGATDAKTTIALVLGPILFLLGTGLFRQAFSGRACRISLAGIGLIALTLPLALVAPPVVFSLVTSGILVAIAVWHSLDRARASA